MKTYRFEVRRIVSSVIEVEAKNQEEAYDEAIGVVEQDALLEDPCDDLADTTIGADVRLCGGDKPWVHSCGVHTSELTPANDSYK